ncbi:peptidase C15, pyroglutamyl peptidase I-like protein [Neoconidiobolus thromboides FSU 785]|nr:peptidase C15, pyroglutamyl peptidase I-like protein [Neoconidiobolus thromboides FSU 785]
MVQESLRKYKVLLTGFEPFGTPIPEFNPSWECIKDLNGRSLYGDNHGFEFEIDCIRLPVEYKEIERIVPTLHSKNIYDYIIHVGQGLPNKIAIETLANSYGYMKKDNQGYIPETHLVPEKYVKEKKEYHLDCLFDGVKLSEALNQKGFKLCFPSNDAGRYLCEYTLFCSLAEAKLNNIKSTKALFVHVPIPPSPYPYEALTQAIKEIVTQLPNFEK